MKDLHIDRRVFLKAGLAATTFLAAGLPVSALAASNQAVAEFKLMPLPYPKNALEPTISARTVHYHYGKHHQGYVNKLNKLIAGTLYEGQPLEEIIKNTARTAETRNIFNNAAQVFNHDFYWNSMKPNGGGSPGGKLTELTKKSFGSHEKFRKEFLSAATGVFGSGYAWLVLDRNPNGKRLSIMGTGNAENPLLYGKTPLLAIDVWEHAYYLDHQNRRPEYVEGYLDKLINWDFAEKNLST